MRSCSDPEPPRKEDHRNRMNEKLKEKVKESLSSVLPITLIVLVLSITLVPMEIGTLALFLTGAVLLIFGMGFFQLGAEMSMTPLGEGVGKTLAKREKVILVVLVSFALGTIITIAEPDLQVLANQVASIPNNVLIWTVAVGVGVFLALAVLRIFYRASLAKCLLIAYALLFALTLFSPKDFLAVAFDAGGVTTGPITVPFIMALGVGVSALRTAQGHDDDSFGLVALCSVGPILMVLLLGIFYHPSDAIYSAVEIAPVVTTRDVAQQFAIGLPDYAKEVLLSILPIVAVCVLFQLLTHHYRRRQLLRTGVGFLYTIIGLILFLTGVNIGFTPVGNLLGSGLADNTYRWVLIPIGALIGYYIVKAEPAVQVLNKQVEDVTGGTVSQSMMNTARADRHQHLLDPCAGLRARAHPRALCPVRVRWHRLRLRRRGERTHDLYLPAAAGHGRVHRARRQRRHRRFRRGGARRARAAGRHSDHGRHLRT